MPETQEEVDAAANGGESEQEQLAEPQTATAPSRRSRRRGVEGDRQPVKSQASAFILSMFFGFLGVDRLYLGSIGLALVKILSTVFAVALLFLDTTSISPSFTPPVACAAAMLLFFVALTLHLHDFILIGLGRMRDGYGTSLIGVPDAKPAACHQGWAFVLALFTGYAGGDRFYLKSFLYGGIKLALFGIGVILLLFANPHWRRLREYPVIYKFTANEVHADTPGASQVLLGLKDHRLTLCAYPTEKEREEYEKANAVYFEKMAKAVTTFVPPPLGGGEPRPPFGAVPAGEGEAEKSPRGEAEKAIGEGVLTTLEVPFAGVDHAALLRVEMEKIRARMAHGLLQERNNAIGHIRAHFSRWPFTLENPRVGLVAGCFLGLSFLLWLIDLLLIGCGKMKDGKGNPLGLDPAYGIIHCLNCHEQMVVDLEQKGLEGVVCRYEECGNQASVPEMAVVAEVIESRETSLRHSVAAISFAASAAACLVGAFLLLWPETAWEISEAIGLDTAAQIMLGGFVIFLGLALWQATAAEKRKVICEF